MFLYRWIKGTFQSIFQKLRLDQEVDDELTSILGMMVDQKIRAGMTPREAVRQARIELGGVDQVKESVREQRMGAGLDSVIQDLRYGLRTLRRRPTFTLAAVAVLGLGIGATATVLTLMNEIYFQRPVHVVEPDRLFRFQTRRGYGGAAGNPDYVYYRDNASTLAGLAAYGGFRAVSYTPDGDRNDQLDIVFVSANFFEVLGVPPALGRTFLQEENVTPGTHPVIVLGHHFWTRALGADPGIVDRTLSLAGTEYRVVGVAPEGFGALAPTGDPPDAWVPIAMFGALTRASTMDWWERVPGSRIGWIQPIGRLAPGVTYEAAEANLTALAETLEFDGKTEEDGAFVQRQYRYGPRAAETLSSLSRMLIVVVGLVFLVALFNAAVLILSRAATRGPEMGIRTALGAGRGRIIRQILAETLLLGLMGGGLGLVLAYGFSDLAASLLPVRFSTDFRPDLGVVLVTFGLSLLTAVTMGLLPALQITRRNLRGAILGRGESVRRPRFQNALVAGQVGLSLMLVAGAFLFARSFWTARTEELGFATEDRLVLQLSLRGMDFDADQSSVFLREARQRILNLPGVLGVTTTLMIPFQGDWGGDFDAPPGAQPNLDGDLVFTGFNAVGPDYFRVADIPIVRGRPLGMADVAGNPPTIVINEALAGALWPGLDPLGRTLPVQGEEPFEVVGVARNANYYQLGEAPVPQTYLSFDQAPQASVHFLIHTSRDAAGMATPVQTALRAIDPRLVFGWVTTMASVFEDETDRYQVSAILVAVFSAVALLMAAAGLYGTISFLVARRTREIGVRMALGANRGRVAGEVMRFGLKLAAVGVVLGLVGAVALRRLTEGFLYGIEPTDPLPLIGACLVLLAVAVLAAWIPAKHATRVDPMEAIRVE
jgi:predicted permease